MSTTFAGGGVSEENISAIVQATGVQEVHGSARGPRQWGRMEFRREGVYMGGEKRNEGLDAEYANKFCSEARVREFVRLANARTD